MKYTREQRLDIGRQIYDGEITKSQAAELYGISEGSARDYMRLYRNENKLVPKRDSKEIQHYRSVRKIDVEPRNLKSYETMTKEELIEELIKSRIREERLKKGYEVKGDGSVIQYSNKSTK